MSREGALQEIVALAREHDLSESDIRAALAAEAAETAPPHAASLLGTILAVLGATFLFAGIAVFIALNWESMNSAARIVVTLGSGVATLVLAVMASSEPRYQKASTPLYLVSAALQPTGILVAIGEFSSGGDWRHAAIVTAAIMTSQQAALCWLRRDRILVSTTWLFAVWLAAQSAELTDADGDLIAVVLGAATIAFCFCIDRSRYRNATPFWYLLGAAATYAGLWSLLEVSWLEPAFLGVACGGVFLSTYARSRTLLTASTLSILAYISYFTHQHFLDSLGWPIVLILLGLLLMGLSAAAIRLGRRFGHDRQPSAAD